MPKSTTGSDSDSESLPVLGSSNSSRLPSAHVAGPLAQTLLQLTNPIPEEPLQEYAFNPLHVDWDGADYDTQLEDSHEVRMTALLAQNLVNYLQDGDIDHSSEDDADERSEIETSSDDEADAPYVSGRKTRKVNPGDVDSPWYPWPDKETCVLDILRHIPRCSFSKKQNAAIHWAMLALGLKDLPSDRVMDDIDKGLQKMCGIQSIRYSGKLGHIYYANDLAAIIAQEMANPTTRKNLHFFPEDTSPSLSQAWQAGRWLDELESDLTTPMIRIGTQDFYIKEPTLLSDGSVCMPTRWFKRGGKTFARVWRMYESSSTAGWVIQGDKEFEVPESDLLISFPLLVTSHLARRKADPRVIKGMFYFTRTGIELAGILTDWKETDPAQGNQWRKLSSGHRVLAFPIWLYCDDTSGNTSKKWNKHNSFLFTAAGLPREFVHRESNIHFLSTSNTAPPLEMLDGIADQLQACQKHGIWAWDAEYQELVLVIPSVLAMLGDNPMQSEFACHIGFRGKFFCRVCWVKGSPEAEGEDGDAGCDASSASSRSASPVSGAPAAKKKKTKKKDESVGEMVSRITQFMSLAKARNRAETQAELKTQFTTAIFVGGQAGFQRLKTASGVKDTFQGAFLERVFALSTKRGRAKVQKQADVNTLLKTFPKDITSPVWRIKDLDPHRDTPVEILHVILLGFVKYFWRDAVARIKKSDKEILILRLSSFNVSGLGVPPLAGHTLVNYAGSLTGRDFRIIVQAAPFVLQGLLPGEYIELWTALSAVVTLVWQPHIRDINQYTVYLEAAIKHFLDCTCHLTLQWFNKPKFHVILHLPAHIRCFGPAMLFATEGFESFNAIIRSCSVHSNRHAPSLDIASKMARGNRVRHLLSRGFFPSNRDFQPEVSKDRPSTSPWMDISLDALTRCTWTQASDAPLRFMELNSFGSRLLGWEPSLAASKPLPGSCLTSSFPRALTSKSVRLINNDLCALGDWVVWVQDLTGQKVNRVGQVVEIVQLVGSAAQREGFADFILVSRTIVGEPHDLYKMRRLQPIPNEHFRCTINIQHNCADNKCRTARTRVVLREREATAERALAIEHLVQSDLIVNTAQMRDAASLAAFRWVPNPLNTANIVQAAAEAAHADRQKQKKIAADLAAAGEINIAREGSLGTSDPSEPAHKRARTSVPAGSRERSSRDSSSSLRRVVPAQNDTENRTIPQTFAFNNTFQQSFR
ncbi:hypothetical protein C8R46DRAFT_989326 [Mycena filopes]|nr:hypothetical protein C8R46DRAFT_989326 [Mycena filopes]